MIYLLIDYKPVLFLTSKVLINTSIGYKMNKEKESDEGFTQIYVIPINNVPLLFWNWSKDKVEKLYFMCLCVILFATVYINWLKINIVH